jgi:branched-chain amino acid transport system substrate-binding protein
MKFINFRAPALAAAMAVGLGTTGMALADSSTVLIPCVCEMSGAGAVSGTNYSKGAHLAVDQINAAGGILGRKIVMNNMDTQTNPMVSRGLVQKAIDAGAYAIVGTVYSGSTIVNMLVAEQAGVPQFTGSEAPNITEKGNPYIFRTSSGAELGIPELAGYIHNKMKVQRIAVEWVNNPFGKGGYDVFMKQAKKYGIKVVADVPSEEGAVDFSADVAKIKNSGAQAVFVYMNEAPDARFLKEARRQGLSIPIVAQSNLTDPKVIQLAGAAANGAMAHVGIAATAPIPAMEKFVAAYKAKYHESPDHNSIKGYIGVYAIKYVTEMVGKFDGKAFAQKMHGLTLDASKYPGMILTTHWDKNGELYRESFMTEVKDGKQVVIGNVQPIIPKD